MAQPPINRAQLVQSRVTAWNQAHPGRTIDPAAELAVARQEGLSGGVGDNGTSFGPNQLHFGGAYPASAPHDPQAAQQWAWSPQGIDYALQQIASVAGGQHGRQAVSSIVSKFERPANPGREIANALAAYGGGMSPPTSAGNGSTMPSGAISQPGMSPPGVPSGGGNRRQLLLALANSVGQKTPDYSPLLTQLLARRQAPPVQPLPATPGETANAQPLPYTGGGGRGGFAELLHEGVGGPTHSTGEHIHFASTNPQTELRAIKLAQSLGLSVRENPYTGDTVDPVHAKNSYHYRTFPGTFSGRKLGEAADASGDRAAMLKLYKLLGGK